MAFVILVVLVTMCLGQFTGGQKLMCLGDQCARKCCPSGHYFQAETERCRADTSLSSLDGADGQGEILCPGALWVDDVTSGQPRDLDCIENVFENGQNRTKGLLCPDPSDRYEFVGPVPFRKCCPDHHVYDGQSGRCLEEYSIPSSVWEKWTDLSADRWIGTPVGIQCAGDSVVRTSSEFVIHENGTLDVGDSRLVESESFCIGIDGTNTRSGIQWIARYCQADPCRDTTCIPKCCPEGSSLELPAKTCVPGSRSFQNWERIAIPSDSYIMDPGKIPNCSLILLKSKANPWDDFIVKNSGILYVPATNFSTDEYCVDDFQIDNETVRSAIICAQQSPATLLQEIVFYQFLPYLLFFSAALLLTTAALIVAVPVVWSSLTPGFSVASHSVSLAVAFISLGLIQINQQWEHPVCLSLAIILHFSFLASFTWLNVISFDIWRAFQFMTVRFPSTGTNRVPNRFVYFALYAWGVPAIIVLVGQCLDHVSGIPDDVIRPRFAHERCWFSDRTAALAYFYGPIALILVSNLYFLIVTGCEIVSIKRAASVATQSIKRKRQMYTIAASLSVMMGLSWVADLITWVFQVPIYYSIPFDVINILTGLMIFYLFIRKTVVRKYLKQKFRPLRRFFSRGRQFTIQTRREDGSFSHKATYKMSARPRPSNQPEVVHEPHIKENGLVEIDLTK